MKKFIINLTIFGLLFLAYDKLFLVFKEYSADKEVDKRLEFVLNGKMNKDIIVLGSSRGAYNIIAGQIEKATGKSAYNLSYPGSDVIFHEFILRALVKYNKPPKTILLAIDDRIEFLDSKSVVFRYERLYPLVKYDFINQELVDKGEKNYLLSKFFVLHAINKTNFNLKQKKFNIADTIMPCGSMAISFQSKGTKWEYSNNNIAYVSKSELQEKLNSFKKIVAICKANHIKLILVASPNFKNNNLLFEKRIKELAGNEVTFYSYDQSNLIYKDKNYFFDTNHLRENGAVIFSKEISNYLKANNNSIFE